MASRQKPARHQVQTKHPRYHVPQYMRGSGSAKQNTRELFSRYPDAPEHYFGYTRDPNQALWITSEGRMISGSKDNVHPWSDYGHMDIVRAYGLDPSDYESRSWQKITGAIRMRRSSLAPDATLNLELYDKPNMSQMRTISRAVDREGSIYVDYFSKDGKPIISQRVSNPVELRRLLDRV